MSDFLLRHCRPSGLRLTLLAAVSLAVFLGARSTIQAAPVTFAFEAEIASVIDNDRGAGLPFAVAAGDTLSASFELESFSGGPQYTQTGMLSFEIAGHELTLTGFLVTVGNDAPSPIPLRGSTADPLNTPIVDQGPGITDGINLQCDGPFSLACAQFDGSGEIEFTPLITLLGDQAVIDSTELSTVPDIWNTFNFREMSLLFRNKSTGGTTRIGAYVGQISIVPEPASMTLALLLIFVVTFNTRQLSRLKKQQLCRNQ